MSFVDQRDKAGACGMTGRDGLGNVGQTTVALWPQNSQGSNEGWLSPWIQRKLADVREERRNERWITPLGGQIRLLAVATNMV